MADSRGRLTRKMLRYGTGSVVATFCSEVTLLFMYGVVGTSTTPASMIAWLAGALPNYWLNRTWTWGRRGRPDVLRELLPYAGIVLLTLVLAVASTAAVDAALSASGASRASRSMVVGATFLLVYVAVFLLRFVLLDRLFAPVAQDASTDIAKPIEEGGGAR